MNDDNKTKKPQESRRATSVRSGKEITPLKPTKPCRAAVGGKANELTVADGNRKYYINALHDAIDGLELHSAAFDLKLRSLGNKAIGEAGLGEADVRVSGEIFDLATRLLALIGKNLEARPVRALGIPLAETSTLVDKATEVQDSVCDATRRFLTEN